MITFKEDIIILSRLGVTLQNERAEHGALERAIKALIFASSEQNQASFKQFLANFDGPPSEAEKQKLRSMGLSE